jgi:CRISPR-associated endonuclease Csy4
MKHYQDVTLLPSVDIGLYFLWQKLYQQVHFGFLSVKNDHDRVSIGVSFPAYEIEKNLLGDKLRLFAQEKSTLDALKIGGWLGALSDYTHVTSIRPVPDDITRFACFKHQRVKSSRMRLARRKAKRHGITHEEALLQLGDFQERRVDTPYVYMNSLSTGQRFPMFIQKIVNEARVDGDFDCYGLSGQSSVPDF